jgi:hypothetical protein
MHFQLFPFLTFSRSAANNTIIAVQRKLSFLSIPRIAEGASKIMSRGLSQLHSQVLLPYLTSAFGVRILAIIELRQNQRRDSMALLYQVSTSVDL